MRVSDESLNTPDWEQGVWWSQREGLSGRTSDGIPVDIYISPKDVLLDLRDARALLREALDDLETYCGDWEYCEAHQIQEADSVRRIRQHLEGAKA